jgi:hypothetical protein
LLAIPGGVVLWRRGERGLVLTVTAIALIYILFITSITFWRGGWGVGPRYITVMLPFLLPLVAAALQAWCERPFVVGAVSGTIVSSVVIYCLAQVTFPYWPDSLKNPFVETTLRLLADNAVAPNVGSALGITGIVGTLPYLATVGGLLGLALWRAGGWRTTVVACGVGCAILAGFLLIAPRTGPHAEKALLVKMREGLARVIARPKGAPKTRGVIGEQNRDRDRRTGRRNPECRQELAPAPHPHDEVHEQRYARERGLIVDKWCRASQETDGRHRAETAPAIDDVECIDPRAGNAHGAELMRVVEERVGHRHRTEPVRDEDKAANCGIRCVAL